MFLTAVEITVASDKTKSKRAVLKVKEKKEKKKKRRRLKDFSLNSYHLRPKCCAGPLHTCTHKHAHTYPEPSRVPAHLISFPSQRGEKPCVTNAPVPAEASSDSNCLLLPNLLDVCSHPFLPSLTRSLSYLLSLFLPPFFSFSFAHSFSCRALWSAPPPCPVSAQCTSIIQRQSTGLSGLSNQSWALH